MCVHIFQFYISLWFPPFPWITFGTCLEKKELSALCSLREVTVNVTGIQKVFCWSKSERRTRTMRCVLRFVVQTTESQWKEECVFDPPWRFCLRCHEFLRLWSATIVANESRKELVHFQLLHSEWASQLTWKLTSCRLCLTNCLWGKET